MFGMDLELRQHAKEQTVWVASRIDAIVQLLVAKGLVTPEEIERAIAQSETKVDHMLAEARDAAN